MKKSFFVLLVIFILIILIVGTYFGARYYFNSKNPPEYFYEHPTIAKVLGISPVCPPVCAQQEVCAKDGKNYCNECLAFQHGAGFAYNGPCKPKNWNTYDNFGIEFQYPNSAAWGLPEENIYGVQPQISFNAASSTDPFTVNIQQYLPGAATGKLQTFDQVVKINTSNLSANNISDISVGGIKGKEFLSTENTQLAGQISNFGAIFPINDKSFIEFSGDTTFLTKDIFDTLISTFKINDSSAIEKNSENVLFIYNNGDMTFEYPATFGTSYASLNLQVIMARPGNNKVDKGGCYITQASSGKKIPSKSVTVNNVKFCLTVGSDVGAGQLYTSYYYSAYHNGYYYVLGYVVHTPNGCDNYMGTPNYQPCLAFEKNYASVVVKPIQNSISTFKFIH